MGHNPLSSDYFDAVPWVLMLLLLRSCMPKNDWTESFNLMKRRSSFAFFPAAAAILPTALVESPIGPWFRSATYLPPNAVAIASHGPL